MYALGVTTSGLEYLSFSISWLGLLLSPSSWPLPSIWRERCPFHLLLCQPRAIVGCTAFPVGSVTHSVEGIVPSPFFLTLWLSPASFNSWLSPREVLGSIPWRLPWWWSRQTIALPVRALRQYLTWTIRYRPGFEGWFVSSRLFGFNNECPVAPFGSARCLPWFMHPFRWRSVDLWGSVLTKSGRLQCLYYLRGTAQSIWYWRRGLGQPSLPSPPSTREMSPISTWIHSPLGLWWRLSRSCNPLLLLAPI